MTPDLGDPKSMNYYRVDVFVDEDLMPGVEKLLYDLLASVNTNDREEAHHLLDSLINVVNDREE